MKRPVMRGMGNQGTDERERRTRRRGSLKLLCLLLSGVVDEVELRIVAGAVFRRACAAQTVADREQVVGELEDAGNGTTGVGALHADKGQAGQIDRERAVVRNFSAEAYRVFSGSQLDLHSFEHLLGGLLAAEFGVERLPDAFEGRWVHPENLKAGSGKLKEKVPGGRTFAATDYMSARTAASAPLNADFSALSAARACASVSNLCLDAASSVSIRRTSAGDGCSDFGKGALHQEQSRARRDISGRLQAGQERRRVVMAGSRAGNRTRGEAACYARFITSRGVVSTGVGSVSSFTPLAPRSTNLRPPGRRFCSNEPTAEL